MRMLAPVQATQFEVEGMEKFRGVGVPTRWYAVPIGPASHTPYPLLFTESGLATREEAIPGKREAFPSWQCVVVEK